MALIDCDQCGREIAGDARRCPHCGTLTTYTRGGRRTLVLVVVLTATIALICWALLNSSLFDASTRLEAP